MNKLLTIMITLSLCVTLSSCMSGKAGNAVSSNETGTFQVSGYNIWVITPDGWAQCETDHLDLQCESPRADMYLSAYGYSKIDLPEDQSVQDLFEVQNDAILSLRDHVTEVEPVSSTENDEKIIYSALYSGEQDGVKNYYHFNFIRFKNTDDMVWILFTGMPSVIEKHRNTIDDIISKVQNSDEHLIL